MWPEYGDHMGWMAFGWIGGLAVLVLLIWVVARAAGPPGAARTEESPEMILKRRYASGEMDREDYERRLADLRK
jgi:putative membrane protein